MIELNLLYLRGKIWFLFTVLLLDGVVLKA
jgi:hypothetical protein